MIRQWIERVQVSRNGLLPQLEIGPRLGGAKVLFQRSGIVMRSITMLSAMLSAWSTTSQVRALFLDSFALFMLVVAAALSAWMVFDYIVILPSQQTFNQGQAHQAERSPLKRDTEHIISRLDRLEEGRLATDGGGADSDSDDEDT